MSKQLDNFINILAAEVGYCEKATNAYLNDKTANAGHNNYTKYGAWYGLNGPSAYWCHMLISWAANKADISTSIIPNTASCAAGRDFFIKQGRWHYRSGYTPQRGDFVYFTTSGYPNGSGHVGLVYMVANGYIYTIEGNTSSGTAVIDNGGEVAYKSYPMTNTAIYGYGSPAYIEDIEEDDEVVTQKAIEIDGVVYTCDVITKDGENYLKLKSLAPAGYGIGYDANTKLASVSAPQRRAVVPEGDAEVQSAIETVQETCGLSESTISYLLQYVWGDDLMKKLAAGMQGKIDDAE